MTHPEQNTGTTLESSDSLSSLRCHQEEADACIATARPTIDNALKRRVIAMGLSIMMSITAIGGFIYYIYFILFVSHNLSLQQVINHSVIAFIILLASLFLCIVIYHEGSWKRIVVSILTMFLLWD